MKNRTIVKKYKPERIGSRIILILLFFTAVAASSFCVSFPHGMLMFSPLLLSACFMVFYEETWKIVFDSKKLTCYHFLGSRSYSYGQITDAYIAHSATMHQHIRLTFSDGKRISFRLKDENGQQAKRVIQSHCSLRAPEW